jgi:hypothetical protein
MRLTPNFTRRELAGSYAAEHLGIDNTPSERLVEPLPVQEELPVELPSQPATASKSTPYAHKITLAWSRSHQLAAEVSGSLSGSQTEPAYLH